MATVVTLMLPGMQRESYKPRSVKNILAQVVKMPDLALLEYIARGVGVPEMWVEDCAQELSIYAWQHPGSTYSVLRCRAIDFVRVFGPTGRTGINRYTVELERNVPVKTDPYQSVESCVDFAAGWQRIGPIAQGHLLRIAKGYKPTVGSARLFQIRNMLKDRI